MKWWETGLYIICISFCYYGYIKSFSIIYKNKEKEYKCSDIFIYTFLLIIMIFNTLYNYNFTKIIISFLNLIIVFKITFNISLKESFFKGIVIYLLGWIIEIICGIFFVYFVYNSVQSIDTSFFLKLLFSILVMLFLLLLSTLISRKKIKLIKKIYNYMNETFNITAIMLLTIIILATITFYLIISRDLITMIALLLLLLFFIILIIYLLIQSIKAKKANERQEILFDFMKEYETIIDKERQDRHEIVNNLLILKSIKDKNTKEYEELLEEILQTYKNIKTYRGLYDLPSGMKGIFYYKIYDMKQKKINISVNISNLVIEKLENLNLKVIAKICKIVGILLDNAKEASQVTNEKNVIIEVYQQNEEIIIYIENSCNKKVNLENLKIKGYSTKGNNRGYGLYLVEKIMMGNSNIELEQKTSNNIFISILKIKIL